MIPEGGKIMSFQNQNGLPKLWIRVDPKAEKEQRIFQLIATGETIDEFKEGDLEYIGTTVLNNGLVFHLFEVKDRI